MGGSASRAAALALAVLAVARAPGAGATERELRVGLVPSGRPEVTRALAEGLRVALDEAARAGGPRVALVVGDESGAWSTVATTAVDLARTPGVVALVTPPERRLAHPVAQVGTRAQVPVVSTAAAASVLATGSTWVSGAVPVREGAEGAEPVAPGFDASGPAARDLVAAYRARHGAAPGAWAAVGLEAGRRLAVAIGPSGRAGADLAAALADPGLAAGSVLVADRAPGADAARDQPAGASPRR